MEIRWEVDDGYCGKSRPQFIDLPDDVILSCEDWDEVQLYLLENVEESFRTELGFTIMNEEEVKDFFSKNKVPE